MNATRYMGGFKKKAVLSMMMVMYDDNDGGLNLRCCNPSRFPRLENRSSLLTQRDSESLQPSLEFSQPVGTGTRRVDGGLCLSFWRNGRLVCCRRVFRTLGNPAFALGGVVLILAGSIRLIATHYLLFRDALSTAGCTTAPEAVETFAVLPHLDRAILGPGGVEITVGREGNGPDRPVMALMNVCKA